MTVRKVLLLAILFASVSHRTDSAPAAGTNFKRVCYYTNWSQFRSGIGTFVPSNIDSNLCTHAIYAFATIEGGKLASTAFNDDTSGDTPGMYQQFNEMKQDSNSNLRTLLAVGGSGLGDAPFRAISNSAASRQTFISDAITFLQDRGFDGLSLDWSFPRNKANHAALIRELKEAFRPNNLLLGASVAVKRSDIDAAYDIPEISRHLDFISLTTFDFHSSNENSVAHHSQLYNRSEEKGREAELNTDWVVNYWMEKGAPPEKLLVGVASYGVSYTLSNNAVSFGAPAVGAGVAGEMTNQPGVLSYYEICDKLSNNAWRRAWSPVAKVPVAYNTGENQWVGYDDMNSVAYKAQYICDKRLGGAVVWALDMDDFGNYCNQGNYPLISRLNEVLAGRRRPSEPSLPTVPPMTVTEAPAVSGGGGGQGGSAPAGGGPVQNADDFGTPVVTDSDTPVSYPSSGPCTPLASSPPPNPLRVVCYFTNWSQYRSGNGKFLPTDVDPSLCTHITFAFASLSNNGQLMSNDEFGDLRETEGLYHRVAVQLKQDHPNVQFKVLLGIGGWTMGSASFSRMVSTRSNRARFIDHAVQFLRNYSFDGLDVDWEYPAARSGSSAQDRPRYTMLLSELKEAFESEGRRNSGDRLLLTASVAQHKRYIDPGYEICHMGRILDFVTVLTFDFHNARNGISGFNSPLYQRCDERYTPYKDYNVDWAVNYWLDGGIPANKLNLGIPMFGETFTLRDASNVEPGAAVSGPGDAGSITGEAGFMAYYEICDMVLGGSWTRVFHQQSQAPYIYSGNQWISYDDIASVEIKAKYVVEKGLGGAMIWALDLDDFSNLCGDGPYPLLTKINTVFLLPSSANPLPSPPVCPTTTTTTTTTAAPPASADSGAGQSGGVLLIPSGQGSGESNNTDTSNSETVVVVIIPSDNNEIADITVVVSNNNATAATAAERSSDTPSSTSPDRLSTMTKATPRAPTISTDNATPNTATNFSPATPNIPTNSSPATPNISTSSSSATPRIPTSSSSATPNIPTSSPSATPSIPTSSSLATPNIPTSSSSTTPNIPTSSSSAMPSTALSTFSSMITPTSTTTTTATAAATAATTTATTTSTTMSTNKPSTLTTTPSITTTTTTTTSTSTTTTNMTIT